MIFNAKKSLPILTRVELSKETKMYSSEEIRVRCLIQASYFIHIFKDLGGIQAMEKRKVKHS
jgi:hypothetical protein